MNYFLKLNVVSILYAVMIFIPVELMVNIYRISRITGLEIGTVDNLIMIAFLIEIIVSTITLFFIIQKLLDGRNASFWTAILWLPYFDLFVFVFAFFFPMTYEGDVPTPATGLIIIGGMLAYPFYILILNAFCMPIEE